MLKRERQNFILQYINQHGTAKVAVISEMLQASHDTIVRDLRELSNEGMVIRVHGGALTTVPHDVKLAPTSPQLIAQKAASLLTDKSFILTSGGEAVMELYSYLPPNFNGTLLTVSMEVACRYSEHPLMEVIQIGDRVQKSSKLTAGSEAIMKIRQIRADMCILDATAMDPQRGMTECDWQTAHVKLAMAESADIIVCLAQSSALGKLYPIQACRPQWITYLITELDPADSALDAYRASGMRVL